VSVDLFVFFLFQLEILEGCRVPVKLKITGEWRKFIAHSGGLVCNYDCKQTHMQFDTYD